MSGIEVVQGDITALDVDAIVNAANEQLQPGGGVCGAIHRTAGPALAEACAPLAPCETGDAVVTDGFALKARWVIHAVGPVWHGGSRGEAAHLSSCYKHALKLAAERGADSIAFPCISTGIYGYPSELAADVAVRACLRFARENETPQRIVLCAFDEGNATLLREALARRSSGGTDGA